MRVRLRASVLALTLTTAAVWASSEAVAPASSGSRQPAWLFAESERFEVHYPPELAPELDRVVRAAEQAYQQISGRLNYVLPTKVPVVLFAPEGSLTREQVVTYALSSAIAPPEPHRSRIVLPLPETDAQLEELVRHELTHILVGEIVNPLAGGHGGVPLWVHEGIASYMAAEWSDEKDRLIRDLVASGDVPALSQLTGDGGFTNVRLNNSLGHVAFDYIENRWGPNRIRRFLDALALGRRDARTYECVFDQTSDTFDASFRQYAEVRFKSVVR